MGKINAKKLAEDLAILEESYRRLEAEKVETQRQIVLMHERVKKLENQQITSAEKGNS